MLLLHEVEPENPINEVEKVYDKKAVHWMLINKI